VNVYWYWPFLRREELGLASGVVGPGDELLVHVTARATDPATSSVPGCTVVAALPNVAERRERSPRWLASRASTYVRRALIRDRTVRFGRFDVCHVMYLNRFTDPVALRRLGRRTALVSSVHDVVPHQRRLPKAAERALLRVLYDGAGTLVVHHDFVRRRLLEEFAVDPGRVFVVPLQVPEVAIDPREGVPSPPASRPVVLFFGAFRRNKGVDVLLDAIRATTGETDATFVFAGRGAPDVEHLVASAAANDPRIRAEIGFATLERKEELFRAADLVVLPYTSFASQSAVLQDAYAHGVPVVVSDVGALGDAVREDGTGVVVPPGDRVALAGAVTDALADDASRRAMSAAAARIAAARRPEAVGQVLRQVYVDALERASR